MIFTGQPYRAVNGKYYPGSGDKIVLSDNITEIKTNEFKESKVNSINLSKITKIGKEAFSKCVYLDIIELSETIEYIGTGAFRDCKFLSKVDGFEKTKIKKIEPYTFQKCNLHSIELPEAMECIGEYAFAHNVWLTNIKLNKNLRIIGQGAFMGTGIENIELPESVEYISDCAFYNCINLSNLIIPSKVKFIGTLITGEHYHLNINIKTSLFYFDSENTCLLFKHYISNFMVYNHNIDCSKSEYEILKNIRNIRKIELKDKIDECLREFGITDKKCFKYSEHKDFIEKILNNYEYIKKYYYEEDFNIYMQEYINKNKNELVTINDIDVVLLKLKELDIKPLDTTSSITIEKFANELNDYPILISSFLEALSSFYSKEVEQIKLKKVLDNVTSTNNILNLINKIFLNTSENDVVANKDSIDKLKKYSSYKISRISDEIICYEKLKEIIKIYVEKLDRCINNLDNINDSSDNELEKSDNIARNNYINIKRSTLINLKIYVESLYLDINNKISYNFEYRELFKQVLILLIPIINSRTSLNKIFLKSEQEINSLENILYMLKSIEIEGKSIDVLSIESKEEKIKKITN